MATLQAARSRHKERDSFLQNSKNPRVLDCSRSPTTSRTDLRQAKIIGKIFLGIRLYSPFSSREDRDRKT